MSADGANHSIPEIAFTFDDPTTDDSSSLTWPQLNKHILRGLDNYKIKAVLFVCGKQVDSEAGHRLVAEWDRTGHSIGNHTYAHLASNLSPNAGSGTLKTVTLSEFRADALRNEALIVRFRNFVRLFRYPFLKEGETVEKRDGMRCFLRERGYRIGRPTIDASDWAVNARLETRIKSEPQADLAAYREFFLEHIWERAQFYHSLAKQVLGTPVKHTLLLHYNVLNALFIEDLVAMFIAKGWRPIDAVCAYGDPVYECQPNILPAGESLIWALAKETGRFGKELRYPGESDAYENSKMNALNL